MRIRKLRISDENNKKAKRVKLMRIVEKPVTRPYIISGEKAEEFFNKKPNKEALNKHLARAERMKKNMVKGDK